MPLSPVQVLAELQAVLQRCPFLAGTDEAALASGTALLRALPAAAQNQATTLLQVCVGGWGIGQTGEV